MKYKFGDNVQSTNSGDLGVILDIDNDFAEGCYYWVCFKDSNSNNEYDEYECWVSENELELVKEGE